MITLYILGLLVWLPGARAHARPHARTHAHTHPHAPARTPAHARTPDPQVSAGHDALTLYIYNIIYDNYIIIIY